MSRFHKALRAITGHFGGPAVLAIANQPPQAALMAALMKARPKVMQGRFYCQAPTARLHREPQSPGDVDRWLARAALRRQGRNFNRQQWAAAGGDRLWKRKEYAA